MSTDTRAALEREVRAAIAWLDSYGAASAVAQIPGFLGMMDRYARRMEAALARSAPEERGERERKGYTLVVEGDGPVVYDTPEQAVAEAMRRVYLPVEHREDQVRLLKCGELAEWGYGFCGLVIYPPSKPASPPAPVEGEREELVARLDDAWRCRGDYAPGAAGSAYDDAEALRALCGEAAVALTSHPVEGEREGSYG